MYGLTRKSGRVVVLLVGITLVASSAAWACAGYPPTVVLIAPIFNAGNMWGGMAIAHSVWGMLILIAIKSGVFYWQSDLKPVRAVSYMFLGNVYSTIPAMLLIIPLTVGAVADSVVGFLLVTVVASFLIFLIPANSLVKREPFKRLHKASMALILSVLLVVAVFSLYEALGMEQSVAQMIVKFICGTASISIAFLISIACEEGVVSSLYKWKYKEEISFMDPVFRANVAAFILMMVLYIGTETIKIASLAGNTKTLAATGF